MWPQYASDNSKDIYRFVQNSLFFSNVTLTNVCSELMSPLPDHIETRKLKGILTGGGGGVRYTELS